ncbi:hypothetical protein H4R33_002270 [Dimargaris cristalligena]|uniref:Ribosomal RNA-processing protein 43 n=1 Tax=Dimargaris cristalligena TaxID=215637 RepID=A0A4Q0A0E5_9FUNG|nr:hypothetical protein H4R33_002270 [Dimargaris cristalligena]RKP39556.1 ribosomal protein S5 domain 2-type protein [Dimargaris cristalligena]|eukprot:RKP39556.1 ribosomal protein S5 domain 2-type protein [Dimargaris cristalligena]
MSSSAPSPFVLSAAAFEKIAPEEYYKRFTSQKIRPDARRFPAFRQTSVQINSISTAYGSSVVRQGNNMVICGIKGEVAEPKFATPKQGYVVPNLELSPICSADFAPGAPSELAQTISHRLDQLVRTGHLLDLEQLCIVEGAAVWTLYVDITCLAFDGNILDAALLALTTALQNTKLPRATFHEETSLITVEPTSPSTQSADSATVALTVARPLFAASFACLPDGVILADPNATEEKVAETLVSIVLDTSGQLAHVWSHGKTAVANSPTIQACIEQARQRVSELQNIIQLAAPKA